MKRRILGAEVPIVGAFGGPSDASVPMALLSRLYDVLNMLVLRADMVPHESSERDLAADCLYHTRANDLPLNDSGHAALLLIGSRSVGGHGLVGLPPQQNLWAGSGSGRAPGAGESAISARRPVRKPKDFLAISLALVLKSSTTPLERWPLAGSHLSSSSRRLRSIPPCAPVRGEN